MNSVNALTFCEAYARTMKMMKKGTHRFFYYWFPVLFYCLVIFVQSSYPSPKEIPHVPHMDKVLHFAAYALLGLLFLRGFRHSRFGSEYGFAIAASIVLTGLYGVSDELHQYFVPYREASIWDGLFDFLGGTSGVYVYQVLIERFPWIRRV